MGYSGACRREELVKMTINDLEFKDNCILVTVPKTKNGVPRLFIVKEALWILLIKQYIAVRPANTTHTRLFLTFRNGYCINSPIGINKMVAMPKIIATILKLANPHTFTGHCFRRSSISHLANKGSDLITIKRHGGWKSSAVAEGYIETSLKRKMEVAQMLSGESSSSSTCVLPSTSTSAVNNSNYTHNSSEAETPITSNTLHTNIFTDTTRTQQNFSQQQGQNILTNVPKISVNAHETSTVIINVYNNCTVQQK